MSDTSDTIVAIASPPGRGGVGIIRLSGPDAPNIAANIVGQLPAPRQAGFRQFLDAQESTIDEGLVLVFRAPASFTGEDIVELQGHGGPVVLDRLIARCTQLGARLARPGEFSERAFLNDKIDLAQAEAIADLIDASSEQAAKGAMKSLQGEFSNKIQELVEALIALRLYVEAAIDFPDEEIDFLSDGKVAGDLASIADQVAQVTRQASQGRVLRDGMKVVLAGKPNAGKSSLLNVLAGTDTAIVTDIPGTTRDVLKEEVQIDGMPLHIIDTAGLRDASNQVERIGIERTHQQIAEADQVLVILDSDDSQVDAHATELLESLSQQQIDNNKITLIYNKTDLAGLPDQTPTGFFSLAISAKHGLGVDELKTRLKHIMGFEQTTESSFTARRRHLDALALAEHHIQTATLQLEQHLAGEVVAEELRLAQTALSEITGEFTADDLLGRIFSSFCIGK